MTTKKAKRLSKKDAMLLASSNLHNSIFDMYRMLFDLTSALVFTNKGHTADVPSDGTLYHLRAKARDLVEKIDKVEEELRPYLKKTLGDPEGVSAKLKKLV